MMEKVSQENRSINNQQNVKLYPKFVFQWHFIPCSKISNLIPGKMYQQIKASDSKKSTARMDIKKTTSSKPISLPDSTTDLWDKRKLSHIVSKAFKVIHIRHLHKQITKQFKDSRTAVQKQQRQSSLLKVTAPSRTQP